MVTSANYYNKLYKAILKNSNIDFNKNYTEIASLAKFNYITGTADSDNIKNSPASIPVGYLNDSNLKTYPEIILNSFIDVKFIFNNLNLLDTVNYYLSFFAICSLLLGGFSIILINNIIIDQNRKGIASLIILGYKNLKINNIFMLIYLPVIILCYWISFVISFIIFYFLSNLIFSSFNILVIPNYSIGIILSTFFIVILIYIASYFFAYKTIKDTNHIKEIIM